VRAPEVALAAFRLRIEPATRDLRWIAVLANFRARWLAMPYGDQAHAMRAETFRRMGGYPEIPIMEDFKLVRRARRIGRVALLDQAIQTSGRRWLRHGVLRTTLINQVCVIGHFVGVPAERLANWRNGRSRRALMPTNSPSEAQLPFVHPEADALNGSHR
jgi:hypothetical protein